MVVTTSHEPPQAAAPGSTRSSCPDVGCIPMCGSARSAARHPAARRRADRNPFFVVVVTLFPLGIGPGLSYYRTIAPGVIWVAALLSSMLTLPRLCGRPRRRHARADAFVGFAGGVIVVAKIVAHWLVTGLPLAILSPLLGLQFGLDGHTQIVLALSLLAGTPVLSLIGAIGGALTLGLRGGGCSLSARAAVGRSGARRRRRRS